MKRSAIFLHIILCIIGKSTASAKAKIMINDQVTLLKQIWILKEGDPKSPWNVKIVPAFLDFISIPDKLVTRGRSNSSEVEYSYKISNNEILTDKAKFKVIALSINNLVLQIGGDYYSYYSLKENEKKVDEAVFFNTLTNDKRWIIGGDTILFTKLNDSNPFITGPAFYKLSVYKEGRKLFGTYCIDIFKEHVFLCFLIDGVYQEKIYEILNINSKFIGYRQIGNDDIFEAVMAHG